MVEERVTQGTMRTTRGEALPLERTDVKGKIDGPVATVEVVQVFTNDLAEAIEAVYLFPLSHRASVQEMELRIGGRVVRAVVKEKEEAKRTYERARAEGRSASLLEQERPNLFTLSVANVPAGATIEVSLAYQEMLAYDGGEWRFVFPMVATERYHAGRPTRAAGSKGVATDEVPDAGRIRPPRAATGQRKGDVTLAIDLDPREPIEAPRSPTHAIEVSPASGGKTTVRLAARDTVPNRDFVLAYRSAREGVRPTVFFEREADRPGTFLLTVTPPAKPLPDLVVSEGSVVKCANCGAGLRDVQKIRDVEGVGPAWKCEHCGVLVSADKTRAAQIERQLPRDVVFLVDRSRSMRGATLAAARRAVRLVIDTLGPDDAVQVFAFDHDRIPADGKGVGFLPRASDWTNWIDAFLAGLEARGGTELEEAIARAAELPERPNRARIVVLLTDAAVGNEGKLLRRLPDILGAKTRMFVLGVGPAVNRWLIERLAHAGRGASDVLVPTEDVEVTVTRFAERVRHGGPVLTNLRLVWEDAMPADVYPSPIPDLFGGQPVQLLGRFVGTGPSRLVLLGTAPTGLPFRQEIDVNLPAQANEIPGLERMWARLRIDARLDRLAAAPEQAGDVRLEVLGLALRHGLLCPYTALVAEDSEVVTKAPGRRVEMAAIAGEEGEDERTLAPMEPETFAMAAALEEGSELASPMRARATAAPATPAPGGAPRGAYGGAPHPPAIAPPPAPAFGAPPAPSFLPRSPAPASPKGGGGIGGFIGKMIGLGRSDEADAAPQTRRAQPPLSARVPSDAYPADVLARVARGGIGELDLVFLVDETGSMGAYIEEVKRRLLEMIDALRAAPLCKSLRLGLVSYRDHPPEDDTFVSRVVPLTDDVASIREGVERMEARGGGDTPEAVTDGLYDVARLEWRARASRVVVWVADAPPHGVGEGGDHFASGCPCGQHWYTQAENCREMGIVIHAACAGWSALTRDVMQTVAKTTRGIFVPLEEAELLVPLIVAVSENELDKQLLEARVAEIIAAHEADLQKADEQERVGWLTDVLRQQNVRPRRLVKGEGTGPGSLRFRAIEPADVEEALDGLRRAGATPL
jgi:Ca-activated chloride channel family protein